MGVRASVDLELVPAEAFDVLVEELTLALKEGGFGVQLAPHGWIRQGVHEVGRVISWKPGEEIRIEWRQASWKPDVVTELDIRFEATQGGTRITVDHEGFGDLLRNRGADFAGWFASEVAAPLLRDMAPARLGDWITDRQARRPSGRQSRDVYRDPLYHRPNFLALLDALVLTPADYLVEIGCGGGAFLQQVLRSGCRAAAIDHSPDMVRSARDLNSEAIREHRLEIREADASRLPFTDGTFSCAASTGVFGFLAEPVVVLREIHRVLAPGGRLALFASTKELRGTPAAPEPMASRLHFYEDDDLQSMAEEAGFVHSRVERPDLRPFAEAVGVPAEALGLFSGRAGQILLAEKM